MRTQLTLQAWSALSLSAMCLPVGAQTSIPSASDAPTAQAVPAPDKLLPLEVTVNGAKVGTWVLIERAGVLYAPKEALEEWRLQLRPGVEGLSYRGSPYLPLAGVPGYNAKIDFSAQAVDLVFSPQSFAATRLAQGVADKPVLSPVLPSVFFNYDLNYATSALRGAPDSRNLGALTELGVSTGWGVLTHSVVGRNLISSGFAAEPAKWTRLETTFSRDFPERNHTLRLGDASTRTGLLGRNVYFGGLQYGSNFALTPGFVGQTLPAFTGLSAAPSTVELYVNDVLRQVSSVPTGPFTIDNLPSFSGAGEARVVVRDLLGRETVVSQSFFANPQLLAVGLNDWGVEVGKLRRDLGISSQNYGPAFFIGTWRRGVHRGLTLEGRTEVSRDIKTISLGAIAALPGALLGRAAVAGSRAEGTGLGVVQGVGQSVVNGNQWLLGADYTGSDISASLQAQGATEKFRQLGQELTALPTKLQLAGNANYYHERAGNFGIGFVTQTRYDSPRVSTLSASYSTRLPGKANLTVSLSRAIAGDSGTSVGVTLMVPLEKNILATASVDRRSNQTDFYASATQNPAQDGELGWRVLAGRQQDRNRAEGGLFYAGRYARLTGDLSASPDQTALRLGASGGVLWADGRLFASQRVSDSFALVEVQGYPGINVSLGSQLQGRTDASGVAMMPRLLAYQSNAVRLDASQLPISAELDSIELTTVPAWRSGVKVVFPVRVGRGALLRIVLDDGEAAPAGATVQIDGDKQEFYVARRGEAFLTGLLPTNRITLTWNGQQCVFEAALPAANPDEIARVGPLLCKGVKR
jgi:outer membrane usher protein